MEVVADEGEEEDGDGSSVVVPKPQMFNLASCDVLEDRDDEVVVVLLAACCVSITISFITDNLSPTAALLVSSAIVIAVDSNVSLRAMFVTLSLARVRATFIGISKDNGYNISK